MRLPEPEPGLVIRYSYLWATEHDEGREEGIKDRPCALIAAVKTTGDGKTRVLVVPITHSTPVSTEAVEIPLPIKMRLELDPDRSWIILSEANEFIWPGPDLRPMPGDDIATVSYGYLPPRFFAVVRRRFLEIFRQGKARRVPRTE